MTDKELLIEHIKLKGLSRTQFAAAMGFSMPTFYSRVNGRSNFSTAEIKKAEKILDLTVTQRNAIFFAN